MNIDDIENFKLHDAIRIHKVLNPALFEGDHLIPRVRKQLIEIAKDFVDFMGLDDLKVADVRIYGSNVGFTYTPHSDIDLHVLIDMSDVENDEVYKELFNAKKALYNLKHPITVGGYDVELYAQDKNDVVKSGGEYSVTDRKWIKYPGRRIPTFELDEVRAKFKKLVAVSELALRGKDIKLLDNLLETIKKYRKAGLEKGGEFSAENLAYKALRSRGIVDKLYKHRDELHSLELSIDEDFHPNEKPPGPEFKPTMPAGTVRVDVSDVYDWYKLGQHISDLEDLGKHDFGKGPPSTVMSFGDEDLEHQYINNLMKTGLTTTDIDPAGHKKIKGQKVDPTYNVTEDFKKKDLNHVYRIDSTHITDFEKNLKTYYHNKDFSVSGRSNFDDSVGKIKGVYAADPLFTALYSTGNSEGGNKKTRYVAIYGPGKPTVYFDVKDKNDIDKNISWLTVFDATNFKKLPSGEYFSEHPGKPVKQVKITDPLRYIKKRGWQIRFVNDLKKILNKIQEKAKTNSKLRYGAEGLGYDQTNEKPVAEDIFESYHNFLQSMNFDYSDCPKSSDFVENNSSWLSYRQKIYKFLWESQGEIEYKHILNNIRKNIWKIKPRLDESIDTNSLFKLMYDAFGQSDTRLIKKDNVVDVIEITSMTDGIAQITTHSDVKIKEVRVLGDVTYIMDYDDEIYIEGKNILGRDISLIIVGKPGTAERGLTLLRLKLDVDHDGNKKWGKWIIDFPEENGFANRLFNKFKIKESASGYIPSDAERDDPRFKTALTVDIGPNSIRDNAIKLGLGSIKRSGVPRTARTDGKIKKR